MAWSQFYGEIKGRARTTAERVGDKDSGLRVFAASKTGGFHIRMQHWDGKDCFELRIVPWCDSKFPEIPLVTGHFVEGENSPVLRLDDGAVSKYINRRALEAMTK
jgi:hypothetical protein